MRYFFLCLLAACGSQIPIQVVTHKTDVQAFVSPIIDKLNETAGCKWIYKADEIMTVNNPVDLLMSTSAIEAYRKTGPEHAQAGGFYLNGHITMMDLETAAQFNASWKNTQSVIFMHELGHAVGFGHSSDKDNWMYPEVDFNFTTEKAEKQFIEALGGPKKLCEDVKERDMWF